MTTPTRATRKFAGSTKGKLDALLDGQHIGHVAFVVDGLPRVMPIAIVRDRSADNRSADNRASDRADDILLHGSTGSPWLRLLATGVPVALSVTELDAIVVARTAFESSMRYRSAVLTGRCAAVPDDDRVRSLDLLVDGLVPGRASEVRPHSAKELAATLTLRMTVDEWSLKISDDWPDDAEADIAGPAWAGVVPLAKGYLTALEAPDLRPGIPVPESVRRLSSPASIRPSSR